MTPPSHTPPPRRFNFRSAAGGAAGAGQGAAAAAGATAAPSAAPSAADPFGMVSRGLG